MHTAPCVEDVAAGSVREDHHLACEVLARPVGGALHRQRRRVAVDAERMQPAVCVEDEAAGAIGQEREVAGDVGARPVMPAAASGLGQARRSERMQAPEAIQDEARLWSRGARKRFGGLGDAPAGPVGAAVQRAAVVGVRSAVGVERVQAVERKDLGRVRCQRGRPPRPRADHACRRMCSRHERVDVPGISVGGRGARAVGCRDRVERQPALVERGVVLADLEVRNCAAAGIERNAELGVRLRRRQAHRHRAGEVGADIRPELRRAACVIEREEPHAAQVVAVDGVELRAERLDVVPELQTDAVQVGVPPGIPLADTVTRVAVACGLRDAVLVDELRCEGVGRRLRVRDRLVRDVG